MFFLFNGNAPLTYFIGSLFQKFSLYSTLVKFDIHYTSFVNCIPKVVLVISDILTSNLVFLSIQHRYDTINLLLV